VHTGPTCKLSPCGQGARARCVQHCSSASACWGKGRRAAQENQATHSWQLDRARADSMRSGWQCGDEQVSVLSA